MNARVSGFLVIFVLILIVNILGPAIRWGMEILIETVLLTAVFPLLLSRKGEKEKKEKPLGLRSLWSEKGEEAISGMRADKPSKRRGY